MDVFIFVNLVLNIVKPCEYLIYGKSDMYLLASDGILSLNLILPQDS
jgi:hypothetical protein